MTGQDEVAEMLRLVEGHLGAWRRRDIDGMGHFTADDFVQWHNIIGRDFTKAEHNAMLADVVKVMTIDYHDLDMLPIAGGVLVRCQADVRRTNGAVALNVPFALVYRVRGGKIVRCDEYMDGASLPSLDFL